MKRRRKRRIGFPKADVLPEPTQRHWCPPVERTKQTHCGWQEEHTNQCGVHNDCDGQANANFLKRDSFGQAKASKHNGHEERSTGNKPASALYTRRNRQTVIPRVVKALFDTTEHEDFIVHREPKSDRKDDDWLRSINTP